VSIATRGKIKPTVNPFDPEQRIVVPLPTGPVTITVEDVTPEMAETWLAEYNTHNRKLFDDRSVALARDIEAGAWLFNGDAIRFAQDGNRTVLVDGQHRLDAIRRSRETTLCLVVRGLPLAAQEVIDTGKTRTFGDTLRIEGGWGSENHVAAVTRMLLLWDRDVPVDADGSKGGSALSLTTKPELRAYLTEHRDEIVASMEVVKAVQAVGLRFAAPASKLASAWALCARKDRDGADLFIIENVVQGKRLDDGHPAKALRDRLLRTDVYRPKPGQGFLLALHAWNHWRNETQLKSLVPPRTWPRPSEFVIR